MPKHKHAELMMQYAQDAMETNKPWERWEYKSPRSAAWNSAVSKLLFSEDIEYRRKPKTIKINGYDVPEPVREPLDNGTDYYTFSVCITELLESEWDGHTHDYYRLKNGVIHLSKEAASLHREAVLSFTKTE